MPCQQWRQILVESQCNRKLAAKPRHVGEKNQRLFLRNPENRRLMSWWKRRGGLMGTMKDWSWTFWIEESSEEDPEPTEEWDYI